MALVEVVLDRIVPNDYNPRRSLRSETVERLVESIETLGFDGSLTVRPAGFESGDDPDDYRADDPDVQFEVISGSQRYEALSRLDYDERIPVNIRYVDRETAKLHALAENKIRSDLTPIEEALAYANYVSVTLERDPEGLETSAEKRPQGGDVYRVNFADYIEYINGGQAPSEGAWMSPTKDSTSVQQAAETIPGVSARTIENKLALLWLPDELRTDVDNGEFAESHAVVLARLRKLGDLDAMHAAMRDLAGEGLSREALRDEVDRVLEAGNDDTPSGDVAASRLRSAVDSHRDLREALIDASQNTEISTLAACQSDGPVKIDFDAAFVVSTPDPNQTPDVINGLDLDALPRVIPAIMRPPKEPIVRHAGQLVDAIEDLGDAISTEREDELADEHRQQEAIVQRAQQNADVMRENSLDRCPHCLSKEFVPAIEDRIENINERATGIADDLHAVRRARSELGDVRATVRDALAAFESDLDRVASLVEDPADADPEQFETDLKPDRVKTILQNAAVVSEGSA